MTPHPIHIIGIGETGLDGLRPDLINQISSASFIAGGERHLNLLRKICRAEQFTIKNNLPDLFEALKKHCAMGNCVVLASGDPLFYGIGKHLLSEFGPNLLRIEPAVSSMQLAFARAGAAWADATIISIHGRDLRSELLPVLGRPKIGIFSHDGDSPGNVAQFFLDHNCTGYTVHVCEHLGGPSEKVHRFNIKDVALHQFRHLNFIILLRDPPTLTRSDSKGYDADEGSDTSTIAESTPSPAFSPTIHHRSNPRSRFGLVSKLGPAMVTHKIVRSTLVGMLPPMQPGDVIWEIGAGHGSVTIELALARPYCEVIALEKDAARFEILKKNILRFETYNVLAVDETAPSGLSQWQDRPNPRAVFVGGSGGQLSAILEKCCAALQPSGLFLSTFVTLENLSTALGHFRQLTWPVEVTELSIAESVPLAGLTSLKPQRGVFIVRAEKP